MKTKHPMSTAAATRAGMRFSAKSVEAERAIFRQLGTVLRGLALRRAHEAGRTVVEPEDFAASMPDLMPAAMSSISGNQHVPA